MHAILGCDTTSALYGIGKVIGLKLMRSSTSFLEQALLFSTLSNIRAAVIAAGEKALVLIYKELPNDIWDFLRLQRFHQKVGSSTSVQPEVLLPSSAAAAYHSQRVYMQVQEWMGTAADMSPEQWGWYKEGDKLMSMLTDKPAAPATLLEVVRCNCRSSCSTRQCTCRKNGLDCFTGCGHCRGSCENISHIDDDYYDEVTGE